MSLTDQSAANTLSASYDVSEVRLAPQFVNRLCARLETAEAKPGGVCGLLFGCQYGAMVVAQAFRSFMETDLAAVASGQKKLDDAIRDLRRTAEKDAALAGLDVVGWYSFRLQSGLNEDDFGLHERQFPDQSDVVLTVRRVDGAFLLFEFYTRADDGVLSARSYRMGGARFSPAQATTTIVDLPLRYRMERMRAMAAAAGAGTAANSVSGRMQEMPVIAEPQPIQQKEPKPTGIAVIKPEENEPEAAPALVLAPPPGTESGRPARKRRIPWILVTALFAGAAGGTFVVLVLPSLPAMSTRRLADAGSGLNLHVETQGDRLMLSWNRNNSVARAAAAGVLHIDDGTLHRDIQLDGAQVANGAVLYHPNTDDVNFRLQVTGQAGTILAENLRVLDGRRTVQPLGLPGRGGDDGDAAPAPVAKAKTPTKAAPPLAANKATEPNTTVQQPGVEAKQRIAGITPPIANPTGARPGITDAANREAAMVQQNTQPSNPAPLSAPMEIPALQAEATPPKVSERQPQNASSVPQQQTAPPVQQQSPPIVQPSATPAPEVKQPSTPTVQPAVKTPPQVPFAQRYVPPKAVRQVLPNIATLPNSVLASAERITVTVAVDTNGRVTQVRAQETGRNTARSVIIAAENAAKQWVFQPATLDGKPVPSEHNIVFQFGR